MTISSTKADKYKLNNPKLERADEKLINIFTENQNE